MTSYRKKRDPKREQFIQLFSRLISGLQEAYDERKADENLTMDALADRLGVTKSRVSKILNGHSNMTVETLSNVAYELGRDVNVHFSTLHSVNECLSTKTFVLTRCVAMEAEGESSNWEAATLTAMSGRFKSSLCKYSIAPVTETKNMPINLLNLEMTECLIN